MLTSPPDLTSCVSHFFLPDLNPWAPEPDWCPLSSLAALCLRNLASWPSTLVGQVSAPVRSAPGESSSCGHTDLHGVFVIYVHMDVYPPPSAKDLNKPVKIYAINSTNVGVFKSVMGMSVAVPVTCKSTARPSSRAAPPRWQAQGGGRGGTAPSVSPLRVCGHPPLEGSLGS